VAGEKTQLRAWLQALCDCHERAHPQLQHQHCTRLGTVEKQSGTRQASSFLPSTASSPPQHTGINSPSLRGMPKISSEPGPEVASIPSTTVGASRSQSSSEHFSKRPSSMQTGKKNPQVPFSPAFRRAATCREPEPKPENDDSTSKSETISIAQTLVRRTSTLTLRHATALIGCHFDGEGKSCRADRLRQFLYLADAFIGVRGGKSRIRL
jgi:hypothetical protein